MHLLVLPVDPTKQLLRQSRNIMCALEKSLQRYQIQTTLKGPFKPPFLVTPDQTVLFNYASICKYLLDPVEADFEWTDHQNELQELDLKLPSVTMQKIDSLLIKHTSIAEMRQVDGSQIYALSSSKSPLKGRKNTLITSALPYVNNVPHLGNIIGCVLSADVFARWSRLRGDNVLFVCGTDEYGTATEVKALQEGVSCMQLCDKYHALHREIYQQFHVEFDSFGRTTTPKHTEISQGIFKEIYSRNLLIPQSMQQLYCDNDQRFLSDRYVGGSCPLCGYDDARGDQCDSCGKLLNASELENPKCKLCSSAPVLKESQHLFLDLPALQDQLKVFFDKSSVDGQWSKSGIDITNAWLKDPLKQRCITRDLKWGTVVPLEEYKDKVLYVWFDAPIGYISITANYTDHYMQWWKPDDPQLNVKLFQFMGKDNVPFHTVIFPGVLMGTGSDKWTMLHHLSTTDYLNYEGGKFSKSRNVGVFGDQAVSCGIDMSVLRYYLLSNRPENGDTMFSWQELQMRCNADLLANLGNFCNRTLKFVQARYNSMVPAFSQKPAEAELQFIDKVNELIKSYNAFMETTKLRSALRIVIELSALGNLYLQDSKLDNALIVSNKNKADCVIYLSVNLIRVLSTLSAPFMPRVTEEIDRQLNVPHSTMPSDFAHFFIQPQHRIGTPSPLFKRIEDSQILELQKLFNGGQGTEAVASAGPKQQSPKKAKKQNSQVQPVLKQQNV